MLYSFRPAYAEVSDIHAVSSAVENAASVRIGLDIDSDFAQFFEAESTEGDRVSGAVEGKHITKILQNSVSASLNLAIPDIPDSDFG